MYFSTLGTENQFGIVKKNRCGPWVQAAWVRGLALIFWGKLHLIYKLIILTEPISKDCCDI